MKKLIIPVLIFAIGLTSNSQSGTETLELLEQSNLSQQEAGLTATLTSSSRLFGDKDDLTSVIFIIPSGSVVTILDSDSTYFYVDFEENEGYIFKRHAVISKAPVAIQEEVHLQQEVQPQQEIQEELSEQVSQGSRFSYLEEKYGSNMAARLIAGKIWKGMNSEMVKDSWGIAQKTNRVISGNTIKEEWIFRNTWLYFENNTLVEWGPIKQ